MNTSAIDKKTATKVKKVARSVSTNADKIVRVCIGNKEVCVTDIPDGLSRGNVELVSIFKNIRKLASRKRMTYEDVIALEEPLRRVMNLSHYILGEFNYREEPVFRGRRYRRRSKTSQYVYKYSCDDAQVMQCMRDVRNLFNHIDA